MTEKPDNPSFSPNISPLSRVLADAATLYGTTVEWMRVDLGLTGATVYAGKEGEPSTCRRSPRPVSLEVGAIAPDGSRRGVHLTVPAAIALALCGRADRHTHEAAQAVQRAEEALRSAQAAHEAARALQGRLEALWRAETGDSPALPNTPNPASASVAPATGAISHDTPATVPVLSAGCGGPEEASSAPSRRPVPVSAALLTAAPTSAQPMAHDGT